MQTHRTPWNCSLLLLTMLGVGCGGQPAPSTPPNSPTTNAPVAATGSPAPTPVALAQPRAIEVAEVPASEIVRELVIEQPATLYFHLGHHYRPPFRLIQTKYKLILKSASGSLIDRQFPAITQWEFDTLQALPDGITAKSSWQELDKLQLKSTLINDMRHYFSERYKTPEAAQKYTEHIRSLPFVKTAEWSNDPEGKYDPAKNIEWGRHQYLRVVSNAGDERHFFTDWWDPQVKKDWRPGDFEMYVRGFPNGESSIPNSPERLAWIKGLLDDSWRNLEHILSDGDIYIFDDERNVRDRLREPKVESLAQIGEILQKNVSKQQRSKEIMRLLLLSDERDPIADWDSRLQIVIEYYDHSPEMQDWIKSIQALNAQRQPPQIPPPGTP